MTSEAMKLENIKGYLKNKIAGWYYNTELDYGISGKFLDAEAEGRNLKITWEEMGKRLETVISWWTEYTPEQLYNIWQETSPEPELEEIPEPDEEMDL